MARRLPFYGWIGLGVMLLSEVGMLLRVAPFYSWHTPIAWTGFILLADALVWQRRGSSWIRSDPAEFAFLAAVSVPLWVVFELYNAYSIRNWHYVGLPESLILRYIGYVWSFATIWPAILEAGDLVSSFRTSVHTEERSVTARRHDLRPLSWAAVVLGIVMLTVPIVYPSQWLAAPVWLGFILLLDPLNARAGAESILGDWRAGRTDRLVSLLGAGLVCGILWEFWNYWAGTKWIYTVPVPPHIKVFEMPILGYGGFPAFAVECFVMYVAVRRWVWPAAGRPVSL